MAEPKRLSELLPGVEEHLRGLEAAEEARARASRRGKSNRRKGIDREQEVARWLRPWYPDACRAVRSTDPDPGDIDCTSPGLFWSVKDDAAEAITAWMAELDRKGTGRIGLLVVKRKGHASPGEWWCWMRLWQLGDLIGAAVVDGEAVWNAPWRSELRLVMPLLVQANYAPPPRELPC
jgi:hypothetical protein